MGEGEKTDKLFVKTKRYIGVLRANTYYSWCLMSFVNLQYNVHEQGSVVTKCTLLSLIGTNKRNDSKTIIYVIKYE